MKAYRPLSLIACPLFLFLLTSCVIGNLDYQTYDIRLNIHSVAVDETTANDYSITFEHELMGSYRQAFLKVFALKNGEWVGNSAVHNPINSNDQNFGHAYLSIPDGDTTPVNRLKFAIHSPSGDLYDTAIKEVQVNKPTNRDKDVTISNIEIQSDSYSLQFKFHYSFQPSKIDPDRKITFLLRPVRRGTIINENFNTPRIRVEPGTGTITFELNYETLDPQFSGREQIQTESLYLSYGKWAKIIDHQKSWKIRRLAQTSEEIPDDPSYNDVNITDVYSVSPTDLRVEFDYEYRSDHGSSIYAYPDVYADTREVTTSYRPVSVKRGNHSTSAMMGRAHFSIDSDTITNSIAVRLKSQSFETIAVDTASYRVNWRTQAVTTPQQSRETGYVPRFRKIQWQMRFENSLQRLPDDLWNDFLTRARRDPGEDPYKWMMRRVNEWHDDAQHWKRKTFRRTLTILSEAMEYGHVDNRWIREQLKHLFPNYRRSRYPGFFDRDLFEKSRSLFHSINKGEQFHRLDVPNFWLYSRENPDWQLPSYQAKRPLFVHFPRKFHVESLHINRDLSHLTSSEYESAYAKATGSQGYYMVDFYQDKKSKPGLLNPYLTKDYSISLNYSGAEWLRIFPRRIGPGPIRTRLRIQAFPDPESALEWNGDSAKGFPLGGIPYRTPLMDLARKVEHEFVTGTKFDLEETIQGIFGGSDKDVMILKTIVLLKRGKWKRAKSLLNEIARPLSQRQLKWLQMYKLLPAIDESGARVIEYWRSNQQEKMTYLEKKSDRTVYEQYSLARLYWKNGQYRKARQLFEPLLIEFTPNEVLGPETHIYYISSLYRLNERTDAIEHLEKILAYDFMDGARSFFFTEVEGVYTHGSPLVNYLRKWLRVMMERKKDWWYEQVGYSDNGIKNLRYFTSVFDDEPIGKFVTNAIRQFTKTEKAFMNHKGMRGGIPAGPITRNQLHMILPWNNTIHVVNAPSIQSNKKSEIRKAINLLPSFPTPLQGTGPGAVISSGSLSVDSFSNRLNSQVNREDTFPAVALPDFLFRIYYRGQNVKHREANKTDREMLQWYLQNNENKDLNNTNY